MAEPFKPHIVVSLSNLRVFTFVLTHVAHGGRIWPDEFAEFAEALLLEDGWLVAPASYVDEHAPLLACGIFWRTQDKWQCPMFHKELDALECGKDVLPSLPYRHEDARTGIGIAAQEGQAVCDRLAVF